MPLHEAKTLQQKNMTEHITPQGDNGKCQLTAQAQSMPRGSTRMTAATAKKILLVDDDEALRLPLGNRIDSLDRSRCCLAMSGGLQVANLETSL